MRSDLPRPAPRFHSCGRREDKVSLERHPYAVPQSSVSLLPAATYEGRERLVTMRSPDPVHEMWGFKGKELRFYSI